MLIPIRPRMDTKFCIEITNGCSLRTCPEPLHCSLYLARECVAATISDQSLPSSSRRILAIIRFVWPIVLCALRKYIAGTNLEGARHSFTFPFQAGAAAGRHFLWATMTMIIRIALFLFFLFAMVRSAPAALDQDTLLKNAQTAQALNAQFQNMSRTDTCNGEPWRFLRSIQGLIAPLLDGESACIDGQRAICACSAWELTRCPGSRKCFALPSIRRPGTVSLGGFHHGADTDHQFSLLGALLNPTLSRLSRGQAERVG